MKILITVLIVLIIQQLNALANDGNTPGWSKRVQTVLDCTEPLTFECGTRLPLYLWPASDPGKLDDAAAEYLVRELDRRALDLSVPGGREIVKKHYPCLCR